MCEDPEDDRLLKNERQKVVVLEESVNFWRLVAKELSKDAEWKMKLAQDRVYKAFDGREKIGPVMPNASIIGKKENHEQY